jgi:hypothetical protein
MYQTGIRRLRLVTERTVTESTKESRTVSSLDGIFVSLTTGNQWWAGTNDHLYLGVVGTVGGRELALGVDGFDDYEEGTVVPYSIGPSAALFGGKKPANGDASLSDLTICQPNVTHVYLRKQGDRTHAGDDAWRLDNVYVYLIAAPQPTRVFVSTGRATLGNEYGNQIWLAEVGHGGQYLDARMMVEGAATCGRDS